MGFQIIPLDEALADAVNDTIEKSITPEAESRSVRDLPNAEERSPMANSFILQAVVAQDDIVPWGANVQLRDSQLRDFYITEPFLHSAVYSNSVRNTNFEYELEGPEALVEALKKPIFDLADLGGGWMQLIMKTCADYYTQDNGAFWELIRADNNDENSPVINIAHLDAWRILRTGNPNTPYVYTDRNGGRHKMKWFQVTSLVEMPSPLETMHGVGHSAVSRILRASQILKDISVYKHEKVSGSFSRAIHLVSGVSSKVVSDTMAQAREYAQNRNLTRYRQPVVLGSVDPSANVSSVQIDLATLPDAFDEDTTYRWYVAQMAMAFGTDYQDFAPLPGGNLGTSQQSEIQHRKSRGKGPAHFMNLIEHTMNTYVLPDNVEFRYNAQDIETDQIVARVTSVRAKTRADRIKSGEISPRVARLLAIKDGDLEPEEFEEMEREDAKREAEEREAQARIDDRSPRADDPNVRREMNAEGEENDATNNIR